MAKPNGYPRRRVFAGAAGLLAAGALAACGSNTGRGSSGGSGPTISQWYHEYGEAGVEQAVKRYAAAYHKATVQVQWTAGDYDTKLATALVGSGGPDVFEQSVAKVDQLRAHQLVDLTDLFGDARDDFTPAVLDAQTVDGKIYGIPQAVDMQMLFYRKSMLHKAGVSAPTTLAELATAARKLTTTDVKGLFVGNDGGAGVLGAVPLWSVGQNYLTADQKKVGFDPAAVAPVLATLRSMYSSGHLLLGAPADWSDPSAFTQGLTAMQWTGLWAVPVVRKALGDDFGVLAWPKGDASGKLSVPVGAYGAAVNAKSPHVDAATAFVKWLWIDRTDYQLDFDTAYGFHIPARKSLAAKAHTLSTGAGAEAVRLVQRYGMVQATPGWTAPMNTAYTDALNNIIRKGSDPERELKTAVATINKQLDSLYQ